MAVAIARLEFLGGRGITRAPFASPIEPDSRDALGLEFEPENGD